MNFLVRWLVNHLLFAGTMFFAAGAPALGAEEGVSDGDSGQGDTGSGSLDDGGVSSGASGPDSAASGADGSQKVQDANQPQPTTHRAVLETFTKSEDFKALQAQKPEVAKAITRLQQTLRTVSQALEPIGGLKKAEEIARVLSNAGGIEALTDLQSRVAEMDEIDAKLAAGDPSYVADIAQNMPEEFAAMMPHAIDKWAESNPEAFTQLIAQNVVGALFSDDPDSPGLANLISKAHELAKDEAAQKILKTAYQWCKNVAAQAKAAPKAKTVNPDAQKLQERQKELDRREAEQFENNVSGKVQSYSVALMRSEIKRQFGNRAVSDETMEDMLAGVDAEMKRRAAADENFKRQVQAARSRKDAAKLEQIGKDFATRNASEAAKLIYGRRYRGMNIPQQVAKKDQPNTQATKTLSVPKAVVIPVKPKDSELILNTGQLNAEQVKAMHAAGFKTIQQATMSNIGFTKTGKVIQWQKDR